MRKRVVPYLRWLSSVICFVRMETIRPGEASDASLVAACSRSER